VSENETVEAQFVEALANREIPDLQTTRPPGVVLEEARQAAKALQQVIESKPSKVQFKGKTYLTYEDWQTVARFYGVTAKVISTAHVQYGSSEGFEARAVALLVATGMEISGADAMCMNDEANWKGKPMFQLRSMAQTRAAAKALRNVLAFVPVLAGYEGTPAEEMLTFGSEAAATAVAGKKLGDLKQRGGKPASAKNGTSTQDPNQLIVFILSFPDSQKGDVLITGTPKAIELVSAKRKPETAKEGEENHRLVKFDDLARFYDVCNMKGVAVKDLSGERK
jgi:hypothetical protein